MIKNLTIWLWLKFARIFRLKAFEEYLIRLKLQDYENNKPTGLKRGEEENDKSV